MRSRELRKHVVVWLVLVALVAITVGSAYVPMGRLNTVTNMGIALVKATLVLIFFMRIGSGSKTVRLTAAAGLVWLFMLVALGLSDFLFRAG